MQVETKKEVTITLVLSKQEADWLHAVVQNPIHGIAADESTADREMRFSFFNATDTSK